MSLGAPRNFDANATAPVHPAALAAYLAQLQRPTDAGGAAEVLLAARRAVATKLGARPDEVFFTSGGTAADQLALAAALAATSPPPLPRGADGAPEPVPVTSSALEHDAVRGAVAAAAARGAVVATTWPATAAGIVDLAAAELALAARPAWASVLLAHNETGAVQPLAEVVLRARAVGAWVHTDAVQAVGRMPVDFAALGVDMLSFAGHKIGAVGGLGVLLVRRDTPLHAAMGGPRTCRRALRAAAAWALEPATHGDHDLPSVQALVAALKQLPDATEWDRLGRLRDALEATLLRALGAARCQVLAAAAPRLPHVSCLRLPGAPAEAVLMALDVGGYAVSAGAACASGALEPSPSLLAMGLSPQAAREVVRISLPPHTSADDAQALSYALVDCARRAYDPE